MRIAALVCSLVLSAPVFADPRCDAVFARIGGQFVDWSCVASTDLTTANPATTPADNSVAGLPVGAFTPTTDRGVIAPSAASGRRTPITTHPSGIQINARFASDPAGQARFLLRLPDDWNGRLVVAGASGTRSEFNGDFAWSDYVVQKGYAYASQNKGVLNLALLFPPPSLTPVTPLSCRLNPVSTIWVEFFDNGAKKPFTEWQYWIVQAARAARDGVKGRYNQFPRHTYAVGTSNGGYQVRRAVEEAPDLFDGGVDWEGTFVDGDSQYNLLTDLPPAIANFPSNPGAIQAAGYPPNIAAGAATLYGNYWGQFWEVTQCQWQKRLDPGWTTYLDGPGDIRGTGGYDYAARKAVSDVQANLNAFANTGKIKVPLITVAGTMDGLLPIKHHARAYADKVNASRKGNDDQRAAQYRLYEVQNGNHIETYVDQFPQLELIQPHAQRAFDLLVDHVENNAALPPDQCIPRGGHIDPAASPGRCVDLLK